MKESHDKTLYSLSPLSKRDIILIMPPMYVCMYMYACMHVCMYVCVYVCMHAGIYACMHVSKVKINYIPFLVEC